MPGDFSEWRSRFVLAKPNGYEQAFSSIRARALRAVADLRSPGPATRWKKQFSTRYPLGERIPPNCGGDVISVTSTPSCVRLEQRLAVYCGEKLPGSSITTGPTNSDIASGFFVCICF